MPVQGGNLRELRAGLRSGARGGRERGLRCGYVSSRTVLGLGVGTVGGGASGAGMGRDGGVRAEVPPVRVCLKSDKSRCSKTRTFTCDCRWQS